MAGVLLEVNRGEHLRVNRGYHGPMLLAQALGEYVTLSALAEVATNFSIFFEELIREWGIEALIALGAAAIVWRIVYAFR